MAEDNVRNAARMSRAGRDAGVAGTPLVRRMRDRLDESGAPVDEPDMHSAPGIQAGGGTGGGMDDGAIREEIRRRAYERYCARGQEPGHAEEDWVEAEKEVRGRSVIR
jgi:hypothetical protein